jgi:hypothetical protein
MSNEILTLTDAVLDTVGEHVLLVDVGEVTGLRQESLRERLVEGLVVGVLDVEVVVDLKFKATWDHVRQPPEFSTHVPL